MKGNGEEGKCWFFDRSILVAGWIDTRASLMSTIHNGFGKGIEVTGTPVIHHEW
jgi:hypothetical protein